MTTGTLGATVRLNYLKIRDVTTKDEEANGASTYVVVTISPRNSENWHGWEFSVLHSCASGKEAKSGPQGNRQDH